MRLKAYRGVGTECPENTYPAIALAFEQGYDSVLVDVGLTSDGAFALVPKGVDKLSDISLSELLSVDTGSEFSPKFKGTSPCTLANALMLARAEKKKLEVRTSRENMERLADALNEWQDVAVPLCDDIYTMRALSERLAGAELGYVGEVNSGTVAELPCPSRVTAWMPLAEISAELAECIKKRGARLGASEVREYSDLERAEALYVDACETCGRIKPIANKGILADMHTHSRNSHDARFPVVEMCEAEINAGVKIMAVTDHCDVIMCCDDYDLDIYTNIIESYNETKETGSAVGDRCTLLTGVELGEGFWFPELTEKVLGLCDYDVVIGSVHAVRSPLTDGQTGMKRAFSQIAWRSVSEKDIDEFFELYFDDVLRCVSEQDIDVMAHLGCVKGYIMRQRGLDVDLHPYEEKIRKILVRIIERGIAMEISASPKKDLGFTYPDEWIIKMYRDMGGYLITMSTDAHHPSKAGDNFREVIEMLKEMGFKNIFYFKNRRSYQCTL